MKNLAFESESEYVNKRLSEHSKVMEQKIYKTGKNVYAAVGFGLSYPVMIEGEDGIIIIDPAETIEMMQTIMEEFGKITKKPVKAVVLSHSHGDHWGGMSVCVTDKQSKEKEVLVIVDETFLDYFNQQSGELLDIRIGRAVWMYGSLLPKGEQGYVNLGCGPVLSKGDIAFIQPNTFVSKKDGLKINISGVDLEFFHCEAETEDAMCVFLPEEKIMFVGDAIQGEIFPNIYTIRGNVRDAKKWYQGIDMIRKYEPHYLVGTHMRPLEGEAACMSLLTDYRDGIQYTHDQAVRMINAGFTPESAVYELGNLPPHLYRRERMGEFYGTFKQGIRGVYDQYIGWFDGEPAHLNKTEPVLAAKRYVEMMGGREAILKAAHKSIGEKDYQWACEILTYPIRIDSEDREARNLKAEALRMLGYQTENATWRNWYLTGAYELDGTVDKIVLQAGENGGFPPFSNSFRGLTVIAMFESIKVKLNGQKSASVNLVLKAEISDENKWLLLEIRNGILEIHTSDNKKSLSCTVSTDKETWAKILTREFTVTQAVCQRNACCHLPEKADQFFEYFEPFTSFTNMLFWLQ